MTRAGRACAIVVGFAHVPTLAILDGTVMNIAEAQISITDEGLLRRDGVFEVVRLYAGRPFGMQEHVDRMARSAESLRLPFDADLVRADADTLLATTATRTACCGCRHPRRAAVGILEALPTFPETIALQTITYSPTHVLDGVESLSYGGNMLASRLAREQGADEALLVSPHGRVLEGRRRRSSTASTARCTRRR